MHDGISDALTNSDSFDISVAFVSPDAILSLFEDFRSHHANAPEQVSRLITSTKNHFNDPRAFWELLHLQRTAGVDVRVWAGSDSSVSVAQGQPFHPKGYVFSRRMRNGTPYYDLFVGSSNLTGAALNTQREWNLKVSSSPMANWSRRCEMKSTHRSPIPSRSPRNGSNSMRRISRSTRRHGATF